MFRKRLFVLCLDCVVAARQTVAIRHLKPISLDLKETGKKGMGHIIVVGLISAFLKTALRVSVDYGQKV